MSIRHAPRIAVLMVLACALAPAASAQATRAEFATIDTNDDGRVSSSEHEVYTRKLFDEMDFEPDDDKLTVAEVMASEVKFSRHVIVSVNILGSTETSTMEKVQGLDANQDGVVSQTEHAYGAAAKFRKMDINNNGELTPGEFAAGG